MTDLLEHSHLHLTHWLLVCSPQDFATSCQRGFDRAAMGTRHRKQAESVQAGDTVLFYLTGAKAIVGLAEVIGPAAESAERIEPPFRKGSDPLYHFPVRSSILLTDPKDYVLVERLVDELIFLRRWPRANWTLAFALSVHALSSRDHNVLARALRRAAGLGE